MVYVVCASKAAKTMSIGAQDLKSCGKMNEVQMYM